MSGLLLDPAAAAAAPRAEVGGKAAGLLRLAALGAPVPPWEVLPASAAASRPWRGDPAARAALDEAFARIAAAGDGGVAVRSSAAVEDGPRASHAGVFETRFADCPADLPDALDAVIDSAAAGAARAYGEWDHAPGPPPMAVIVQARVAPVLAGVAFSADPAAADPDWCYVEAVRGHGSGLADGARSPSRFHLAWGNPARVRAEAGPDGPDALPPALAAVLAAALPPLEDALDAPVDVEWAVDAAGRCWLLQARPATALAAHPALPDGACLTSWFFDQRFADPIHPVTRDSLLAVVADAALGDALRMRGAPAPGPLVYFHLGQAYVPHAVWRAMLRGAPRCFLSPDLRQLFPAHCACAPPRPALAAFLDYARCAARNVWRERGDVLRNLRAWRRFEGDLDAALADWDAPDPADAAAWARAWHALDRRTRRFLEIHRWSILWADYFYRAYRLAARALPGAARARLDAALRARTRLVTAEANAALAETLARPDDAALRARFLADYGHRAASLDLAAPTWAELAAADRLHDAAPPPPTSRGADGAAACRGGGMAALVVRALWPLRRLLELREAQRFTWERILARQRALLRDAGRLLRARGALRRPDDAAFLAWAELRAALDGAAAPAPAEIDRRRHAHRVHSRVRRPLFLHAGARTPANAALLRGLAGSPGVARGRVAVIPPHARPVALGPGDIAVLVAIDPAWTALMRGVGGLVIERGGLLSHAAILAREYGVPLVIGVDHATAILRDGEAVEVDGDAGAVRRLG